MYQKVNNLSETQIDLICVDLFQKELANIHNCHDCNAEPNQKHLANCDVVRCSICGGQLLSCSCEDGQPDIWTGLWPGVKECYEKKLICFNTMKQEYIFDLNELAILRIQSRIQSDCR